MQISHAHTSKIQKIIFPCISVPLICDKYFYSLRHSGSQILTNMGTLIGSTRRIYLKLAWKLQAAGMPLHRKLSTWCMGRLMAMPITCRQLFLYLKRYNSSGMGLSASIGLGWKKRDKQSVKNMNAAFSVKHAKLHLQSHQVQCASDTIEFYSSCKHQNIII